MQRESCGCFLGNMQRHDHSPETWLDEADRKRLAAALAGAREARVYRRLEALLLVAEGHSAAEAARRCRVNRSSVHRWLVQFGEVLHTYNPAAAADGCFLIVSNKVCQEFVKRFPEAA